MLKLDDLVHPDRWLQAESYLPRPAIAAEEAEPEAEAESTEEAAEGEAVAQSPEDAAIEANPLASRTAPEKQIEVKREFSQIEVDLLQSLSKRREEIEAYSDELGLREKVLEAAEKRVDQKLASLTELKTEIEVLLKTYEKKEDTEIRGLVKIYESMKPKEAARIFNELDMDILLQVIDRMSERKAAPVLASMTPTRAKDVTENLAELRRLRGKKVNRLKEEANQ